MAPTLSSRLPTPAAFARHVSKTLSIVTFATAITSAFIEPALAASSGTWGTTGNEVLTQSCGFLDSIKSWIFGVTYVLGAIGLVLIAVSAFLGRFKFAHLIALGGGLFVVAAADMLITFVTAGNNEDCTA